MTLPLKTQRELERWYKLIEHPVQIALDNAISNGVRFPVVPAGRRSGKTERAKRFIAKMAMQNPCEKYFVGAPTYGQVKKMYWQDLKDLCLTSLCDKKPSETDLIIYLDNDTEVHLIGFDKPERFEGLFWSGGIIDEIADIKADAWEANIRPALDTFNPTRPDYKAWCWLIGVPDGLNHYYDLAEYAQHANDPEWGYFHWKSSEILPASTIEAAKRQMSSKQFKQEYEASFETASGRIYEDYGPDNLTGEIILSHERLLWFHDFNFTPMSSGIGVRRGDNMYLLDDIILESAVATQSALEFVERYKDHRNKSVLIYGDPAGRAGEKHGHSSDYTEIERILREHGWTYERRVKPSTRSIKDGQNAVRAKIRNAIGEVSLFVNPVTARFTHKALSIIQLKEGSTFLEANSEYQHIGTAIRYLIDYEFPIAQPMQTLQIVGL
jgi:hypothetical protein